MITIGTVKFDLQTDNEEFSLLLYARWDKFFQASFETIVEEVLSHYDREDETILINHLSLDLPVLQEEDFDKSFSRKLREALHDYFRGLMTADRSAAASSGVKRIPIGQSVLDILCFFLLHGYLPFTADQEQQDVGKLLEQVLQMAPDEFRQFLERYAHYDFLYKRLVYQFNDEQLDAIVEKVHPSEAKFIHLYTRIQLRTYQSTQISEISYSDYRNAVWTLVLAYLFHEGGGRFNKKQLVLHTLRGLSARFNLSFVELTRMLSDKLDELEKNTMNLPELWSILKEIRKDIHGELLALDGNYLKYAFRDIISALRMSKSRETAYLVTPENLWPILSDLASCRKLLQQLRETEIHLLVEYILPQESEFIIVYACLLDKHEEQGYFRGKVGNDFRLIKWEFIFAVICRAPLSFFSQVQFVLQVTQQLAAHYNLTINEIVRALLASWEFYDRIVSLKLLPVLKEIAKLLAAPLDFHQSKQSNNDIANETHDWQKLNFESTRALWYLVGPSAEQFIRQHTETELSTVIQQIIPAESEFILLYSKMLDVYSDKGLLEGKAGSDFWVLKWMFIFSCLLVSEKVAFFHRKYFVYDVVKQLAAHYNQQVVDLLGYFYKEFASFGASSPYIKLVQVLNELYLETLSSSSDVPSLANMSKESAEQWIIYLFGVNHPHVTSHLRITGNRHLEAVLNEGALPFRELWRSGRLDEVLIFSILRNDEKLQRLWIRRIGDIRLLDIYQKWMKRYSDLRNQFPQTVFLHTIAFYLSLWIVQLTARRYASWSTTEIERFLTERVRQSVPEGMIGLFDQINNNQNNININQIVKSMNTDLSEMGIPEETIPVSNAGLALLFPFYFRLFKLLGISESVYKIKNKEEQLRAIFLLQYVLYGEAEYEGREDGFEEHELMFNKIIVNWQGGPLPKKYDLLENDKKVVEEMLANVLIHWEKMKRTGVATLRRGFLQRAGVIKPGENENSLILVVEEHAYDILLDSLPWTMGMQQLFNSKKILTIKWRK